MVSAPLAYGAKALLQVGLVYRPEQLVSDAVMTTALASGTVLGLIIIALPLLVSTLAAIAGNLAVGGWIFSAEAITPPLESFNPPAGLQRMFSLRGRSIVGM